MNCTKAAKLTVSYTLAMKAVLNLPATLKQCCTNVGTVTDHQPSIVYFVTLYEHDFERGRDSPLPVGLIIVTRRFARIVTTYLCGLAKMISGRIQH